MKRLLISAEQAQKIESKLPAGRTIADLRLIRCSATVEVVPQDALNTDEQVALAGEIETAGGPPLITNGKPTIMRVVAWMVHEGINKNRLEFLADDLGPAADAIRIPNILPMDWNHSAFNFWSSDAKAIGVWYAAEKRWDSNAKDGAGAYGIMVQGIVWSWLFPEYATEMLAQQARNGKLEFSMACLPTSITLTSDEDGPKEIAHQPIFLTNAALDVPPADDDAVGIGVEESDDPALETTLKQKLSAKETAAPALPKAAAMTPVAQKKEEQMDELQEQVNALQDQLISTRAELIAATARITELEDAATEAATTTEALIAESATSAETITTLRAELAAATARLADIDAATEAAANAARYAERIAALPESYREALNNRSEEERARFETKWTAASDEAWTEFAGEIQFAFQNVRMSYLERSAAEGRVLPNVTDGADDIAALVSAIRK